MKRKNFRHHHSTPNPRFVQEEAVLLATVERALASSTNSATIGRNGEIPLLRFLERYLPNTLKVASGHFLTPSGDISPQIDIMVLDARYPLLSENADGSVLAMLHSVVTAIEVKTNLTTRDIPGMWQSAIDIMKLSKEVEGQYEPGERWFVSTEAVAYRTSQRIVTIEDKFFGVARPKEAGLDTYILRLAQKDQLKSHPIGVTLHLEPPAPESELDDPNSVAGWWPSSVPEYTPLNDFYYSLVWSAYFILDCRQFSLGDIAGHAVQYMSWSTAKWDE